MLEQAYNETITNGELSREWFNNKYPKQAMTSPCGFTTLGGILENVGLVSYNNSKYIKR